MADSNSTTSPPPTPPTIAITTEADLSVLREALRRRLTKTSTARCKGPRRGQTEFQGPRRGQTEFQV